MTTLMLETRPDLREFTAACFKIGCLGFGGPAGQIALMHRVFVDEKKWIDEQRYLHALSYCTLLPGPEAQQLATYVGWLLHGTRGGMVAGLLFVIPGALVVLALSWIYAAAGHVPLVEAAFYGIRAAVFALVAEALLRIGKRALTNREAAPLAVVSFLLLFFTTVPFPIVVLGAGCIGLFIAARTPHGPATDVGGVQPSLMGALVTAALWLFAWFAPLIVAFILLGPQNPLTQVGRMFSTLSVVTFGGAYATLAYLKQQAVETYGWVTAPQMIDGLGLAETTPGPLVLVNQFVGFMAGWKSGPLMAIAGAAMASWCTFAPSFVWIFAGAPFAERLRSNRFAAGALKAITAAALGVIANLAVWFAVHVLFRRADTISLAPGVNVLEPDWTTFDAAAAVLMAIAAFLLFRHKVGVLALVAIAATLGVLARALVAG